jgi:hypothetical protein
MRKKNKAPEKKVEMEILGWLRAANFACWKVDRQGTYDPIRKVFRKNHNPYKIKGISDIQGFIFDRGLFVEVKSETGVLSPEQRKFLAMVNNNGQIGFVARSLLGFLEELAKHFPDKPDFQEMLKQYIGDRRKEH